MQIDIKSIDIEPLRHTYDHVAKRIGDDMEPTRYQEATFDLQPSENFHYRPLWDTRFEIYDADRTQIKMTDWYALTDPRQYYYATYTIARSKQYDAVERSIGVVSRKGLLSELPPEAVDLLVTCFLPIRHFEWGANLNNNQITTLGYGAAITQMTMFSAIDRLGLAQLMTRIGWLLRDAHEEDVLAKAKQSWLEDAVWQPIRELVEKSFLIEDWYELLVAQNFVYDTLLYDFVLTELDSHFYHRWGAVFSMLTEFMNEWQAEQNRWVDAVISRTAQESEANKALLLNWINRHQAAFAGALQPLIERTIPDEAGRVIGAMTERFEARLQSIGLTD